MTSANRIADAVARYHRNRRDRDHHWRRKRADFEIKRKKLIFAGERAINIARPNKNNSYNHHSFK